MKGKGKKVVVEAHIRVSIQIMPDGSAPCDVSVNLPDDSQVIFLQPGIEYLIHKFCQMDREGYEQAMERLMRGAMRDKGPERRVES